MLLADAAAHAVEARFCEARFFEAQRATCAQRAWGLLAAPPRPHAGRRADAFSGRVERRLDHRTGPVDRALGRAAPRTKRAALARRTPGAARVRRSIKPAGANGRMILRACLPAPPLLVRLREPAALGPVFAWGTARPRAAEAAACASLAVARA